MTYYINTNAIQDMLDSGHISTSAMMIKDDLDDSNYLEFEIPDHVAAALFRTGVLCHARTHEPWPDLERSMLRKAYCDGIDLTRIALSLDRSEGEIFKQLHFMFGPTGDLFDQMSESKN